MPGFTLGPDGPLILLQREGYCPASSEEPCAWGQDEDTWLVGLQNSGSQRHGLTPDPQMPKWESGVEVYGAHQQVENLRAAAILFSLAPALCSGLCLPSQFLYRFPNCPPSWFISVEIWEQVEDSLVTAFILN
uniref:Uncharacterized protein n=1 Tax=Pipistrellus kuhlii TaxID=59472 RepID=A0A7J7YX83_PIPKU|nr:hypothetical protein mPipKuh1_009848 [Pipistrellus kuhlii]